jgi:hypothetical protein
MRRLQTWTARTKHANHTRSPMSRFRNCFGSRQTLCLRIP